MSNYRVRQVMKLRRPQRQKDFLTALATFMNDDGRTCRAGFDAVMEAAGQARNTARLARRELEESGDLKSSSTGTGRGHVTEWAVLCLPEVSPETVKGVNAVNPVSYVDPLPDVKGVNPVPERGSNEVEKGGQGQASDLQEPNTLNRSAKQTALSSPGSLYAELAAVVPDVTERETELVRDMIGQRPGVRAANAVMRREIADGNGPALVATVRGHVAASARAEPDLKPSAVPYAELFQGRECDHGDPRGPAGCALCRHAPPRPRLTSVPDHREAS